MKSHNADHLAKMIVLMLLNDHHSTGSELANLLGIKPSAMSSQLDQLEEQGLVERIAASDARKKSLHLTAKGKQQVQTHLKLFKEKTLQLKLGLTEPEVNTLITLLDKINLESL